MNSQFVPGYRTQSEVVNRIAAMLEGVAVPYTDLTEDQIEEVRTFRTRTYFKGLVTAAVGAIASTFRAATTKEQLQRAISGRAAASQAFSDAVKRYNEDVLTIHTPFSVEPAGYQLGDSVGFFRFAIDSCHFVWVYFAVTLTHELDERGLRDKHGVVTLLGADCTTLSKSESTLWGIPKDEVESLVQQAVEATGGVPGESGFEYGTFQSILFDLMGTRHGVDSTVLFESFGFEMDYQALEENRYEDVVYVDTSILNEEPLRLPNVEPFSVSPFFTFECGGTWYSGVEDSIILYMKANGQKIMLRQSN